METPCLLFTLCLYLYYFFLSAFSFMYMFMLLNFRNIYIYIYNIHSTKWYAYYLFCEIVSINLFASFFIQQQFIQTLCPAVRSHVAHKQYAAYSLELYSKMQPRKEKTFDNFHTLSN